MTRRIPRTTRTDTRFPYETLFRSHRPTKSLCGAGQPTSATLRHVSPSPLSEPESERDGMSDEYSGPLLSAPADARFLLHPGDESRDPVRSEEHTPELQSLMRHSYTVLRLKKKKIQKTK